jgi:hypothetical protein
MENNFKQSQGQPTSSYERPSKEKNKIQEEEAETMSLGSIITLP